jgi:hypothetical protein
VNMNGYTRSPEIRLHSRLKPEMIHYPRRYET